MKNSHDHTVEVVNSKVKTAETSVGWGGGVIGYFVEELLYKNSDYEY